MLMRRLAELSLAVGATVVLLAVASGRQTSHAAEPTSPVSWQGLVADGPRASVNVGQRMIVLLKSPSLAERVALRGGAASGAQERKWTSSLLAQQRLLRSRLEVQGVEIHPEFSFTHVVSGFSAALDATAVSLLERDSAVQGVYPVRIAYPASISSDALERRSLASSVGNADLSLPGFDGRGVTIALLDTGDERRRSRRKRVPDPRRGVANGREGRLRSLFAHRSADRRSRACCRSERRRRRTRCRAHRSGRRRGTVRRIRG